MSINQTRKAFPFSFLLLCLCLLHILNPGLSFGQRVTAETSIDKTSIEIGEPLTFIFKLTAPNSLEPQFQIPDFSKFRGLEVLEELPSDTVFNKDNSFTFEKHIILTSFDTGTYLLPPIGVYFPGNTNQDTIHTRALNINVEAISVDLTKDIKDIKPPIATPFILAELWDYLLIFLLLVAFGISGFYVWKVYIKKDPEEAASIEVKPNEPAYVVAMRNLEQLKEESLLKKNKYREYHSRLSDHVRHYIQNQFNIHAMENTSEEILDQFVLRKNIDKSNFEDLVQVLSLADQVKFAKVKPTIIQSEHSFECALKFVTHTKDIVEPLKMHTTKEESTN